MPRYRVHGNALGVLVGFGDGRRGRSLFLASLALALLAVPHAADAQRPAKVHRIGLLGAISLSAYAPFVDAFRQGLRDLGYVEGKNMVIESRWAEGRFERLPDLAAELVRLQVDVIVTHGPAASRAAKEATTTIPIVMAVVGDAIAYGLVPSLARPGGNITGSSFFLPELAAKRLELLKETVPGIRSVAVLVNPGTPTFQELLKAMNLAAGQLGVELQQVNVRAANELEGAFAAIANRRAHGLAVYEDALFLAHAKRIAERAVKGRLPTIGFRELAEAGGLMSYGVNLPDIWRRAAVYVDKILKGTKPAELPVEQPTRFEFVVNMKTAKILGVTFPPTIMVRADQVIE